MIAVFKREVSTYFKSMLGYLFTAFVLIFAGIYTLIYNLSGYYSNFEYTLDSIAFIYMIAVPVLTMRSVAEEKRQKTDQLLYSLPMTTGSVILGKYLAMLVVLALPCAIMALYPVILSSFGTVVFSTAYNGLVAFFLLGACLLSIGLFISAMSDNQVAAAVITLVVLLLLYLMTGLTSYVGNSGYSSFIALSVMLGVVCLVLYLMTKNWPIALVLCGGGVGTLYYFYNQEPTAFWGLFPKVMEQLSVFDRFYTFVDGVFDLTHVVFFLSVIAVFLYLSVQALEKRRWSE